MSNNDLYDPHTRSPRVDDYRSPRVDDYGSPRVDDYGSPRPDDGTGRTQALQAVSDD